MAKTIGSFTIRADGLDGKKANEYERMVGDMLRGLEAIAPSRALLDGFRAYKRDVLVVPYEGTHGTCNALVNSDWGLYNTKVWFTPSGWYATSPCVVKGGAGDSAHEVLVHELVHAFRSAAGTLRTVSDPDEEILAILVTNIFSSRTNRPLRRDHSGSAPLTDPVLSTSSGFLNANRPLIEVFAKQHPNVSRWLARVQAPFNPLQEYWSQVPVSAGGWAP